MKILNVAKTAILNSKDEVLLIRRSQTDTRHPGDWDLPGGELDEGEGFEVAGSREIHEEIGVQISAKKLKPVYTATTAYHDKSVNRVLFVANFDNPQINLSYEHDEYRWVDIDTALREFQHPFYNAGLKYAKEHNLL